MENLLSNRIKEIINSGFTQADLYRAAGVTKGTPNQWMDGKIKSIKLVHAQGIQTLTGYNATWIVTGKGNKKLSSPNQKNSPDIQLVIDLMNKTDSRGRAKALIAVQDALDMHESHLRKTGQSRQEIKDQIDHIGSINRKMNQNDFNDDRISNENHDGARE